MPEAELKIIGKLSDLIPSEQFNGTISPQQRLNNGELHEDEVTQARGQISDFYVTTSRGSYKRCVDGRTDQRFDENGQQMQLGPQVQGGTIDEVVATRIALGIADGITLEHDVATYRKDNRSHYHEGVHTDTHAGEDGFGCGAIKGLEAKLKYYMDEKSLKIITGVTDAICSMGKVSVPQDFTENIRLSATGLDTIAPAYFARKLEMIKEMKTNDPDSLAILDGVHNEVFLLLNFVTDTTFDTSRFNAQTKSKIQAFGLDVWNVIEEHGNNAAYVIADAIATTMNLTDGSVEVIARQPVPAETN